MTRDIVWVLSVVVMLTSTFRRDLQHPIHTHLHLSTPVWQRHKGVKTLSSRPPATSTHDSRHDLHSARLRWNDGISPGIPMLYYRFPILFSDQQRHSSRSILPPVVYHARGSNAEWFWLLYTCSTVFNHASDSYLGILESRCLIHHPIDSASCRDLGQCKQLTVAAHT